MASTFKMFSWKRKTSTRSPAPPQVIISEAEDEFHPRPSTSSPPAHAPAGSALAAQQLQRSRSSRPTSPSSATFGASGPHWARRPSYGQDPVQQGQSRTHSQSHYQEAPSVPRETVTCQRSSSPPDETQLRYERPVGRQNEEPCRVQSMYASSAGSTSSLNTVMDYARTPLRSSRRQSQDSQSDRGSLTPEPTLPMFNIIPATPQQADLEAGALRRRSSRVVSPSSCRPLDDAICIVDGMQSPELEPQGESCELFCSDEFTQLPMIDVDLDFSPFSPVVDLPEDNAGSDTTKGAMSSQLSGFPPSEPLPPSPPFRSYDSLPSLSSISSSLSTSSSLYSFPDVDEALGSMLASLSDPNLASLPEEDEVFKAVSASGAWSVEPSQFGAGVGLGLGLGLESAIQAETPPSQSVTLPLTPRSQRRAPPPPLVLVTEPLHINVVVPPEPSMPSTSPSTMSLMKNHRVAFYGSAKAHPASPTAGVFIGLDGASPASSSGKTPLPSNLPLRSASGYFPVFDSSSSASTPTSARSSTCSISSSDTGAASNDSHSSSDVEDELAIRTASIISLVPSPQLKSLGPASPSHACECQEDPDVGWAF